MVGSVTGFPQQPVTTALQPGAANNDKPQPQKSDESRESGKAQRAESSGKEALEAGKVTTRSSGGVNDNSGGISRQRGSLIDITA